MKKDFERPLTRQRVYDIVYAQIRANGASDHLANRIARAAYAEFLKHQIEPLNKERK